MFVSNQLETLLGYTHQADNENTNIFYLCTYSREISHMFLDLTKILMLAFLHTVEVTFFKLCMIITLLLVY